MILKEKFNDIVNDISISNEELVYYSIKIADNNAIDFAEWLIENKILSSKMPLRELLDMFKKEKGL